MRRMLSILLALCVVCTCAAAVADETHSPVTICLYTENATNGANEARLAEFESLYPWITVNLVEMPAGSTDRMQMLSTVLQAKDSSMDAFIIDCTWPQTFESAGWLEPLDDVYTADELSQFSQGALDGCYVNGTLYCLPLLVNTGAMLYRMDLLQKYGFEPAQTWDEMIEQCQTIMAGEPGIAGYGAAWQQAEALTCCAMEHIWGFGGDVLNENGEPAFNSEAVKNGVASMKKIMDSGIVVDGILGMKSKDVKAAFFAGQIVYIRDWSAALGAANDPEQSSVAGNVGVAQLPSGGAEYAKYNCNGGWNIGVSAFSEHKEEAKLLVKYWTGDSAMLNSALMAGKMPARPALYSNETLVAQAPDMANLLDMANSCRNRPGSAYYEEVSASLQQAVSDVLLGNKDIDTALNALQETEMEIYSR